VARAENSGGGQSKERDERLAARLRENLQRRRPQSTGRPKPKAIKNPERG
jgi:hypothetical protein